MLYKDLDNILESKNYQQNEMTKTTDMRTLLRKYRWRWVGHDLTMSDNDITSGTKIDPIREKKERLAKNNMEANRRKSTKRHES